MLLNSITIVLANMGMLSNKIYLAASISVKSKYHFALLALSSFTGKLLHLYSHRTSIPVLLFVLYLPTFLLPDVVLITGSKVLLYRHECGRFSTFRKVLGGIVA